MPLKVRRISTSLLLVLFTFLSVARAQTPPAQTPSTPPQTSGDVMRERVSRAKAFIAVRNYNAAIYELENIRRESNDTALQGVVYVLLMNSYLEQGDYKRAGDMLNETYAAQKTTKPNAAAFYRAVAGQIVKSARDRADRYNSLGLNVSDRSLPLEATNDLEKMRETLEVVITQAKEIGKDKTKTADAMALVEEASNSRSMLARDDYDARRWRDEVADTREAMANSRSVVLDASSSGTVSQPPSQEYVAVAKTETVPVSVPPAGGLSPDNSTRDREVKPDVNKPAETKLVQDNKPVFVPSQPNVQPAQPNIQPLQPSAKEEPKEPAEQPKQQVPNVAPSAAVSDSPLAVGALTPYATESAKPSYPMAAKNQRTTGVVTVEVLVDESGKVSSIQKASGPTLLQSAAKDAIKKWRFKPFLRDGLPVKATGFVSFNFTL
jgi:TonB family protein